jgi:hypothetical protein
MYTEHAIARIKERLISDEAINMVLAFGSVKISKECLEYKYNGLIVITCILGNEIITAYNTSKVDKMNKRKVYSNRDPKATAKNKHKNLRKKRKWQMNQISR